MNWKNISKYRSALMGFFTIYIMIFHNKFIWDGAWKNGWLHLLIQRGNVGVDGFLFLSGAGLFFSMSSDENVFHFYKKRIVRILIPYILFAVPFYIWKSITMKGKVSFFSYFFQAEFVNNGSSTTWFIPCILVLYLVFPLIYFLQNRSIRIGDKSIGRGTVTVLLCAVWFLVLQSIISSNPKLYDNIEIALTRAFIFIIGCHCGRYMKEGKNIPGGYISLSFFLIIFYIYYFLPSVKPKAFWIRLSYVPFSLAWVIVLTGILSFIDLKKKKKGFPVLSFFGKRSLELYLTHVMLRQLWIKYFGFPTIDSHAIVDYLAVIAASVLISTITHPLIDKISGLLIKKKNAISSGDA